MNESVENDVNLAPCYYHCLHALVNSLLAIAASSVGPSQVSFTAAFLILKLVT